MMLLTVLLWIFLPDFKNISNIAALRAISINDQIKIIVNTGQSLTDDEQLAK
jgi:hypothetical protein